MDIQGPPNSPAQDEMRAVKEGQGSALCARERVPSVPSHQEVREGFGKKVDLS